MKDPTPWASRGLCAEIGDHLFFPSKGSSPESAKRICRQCPVVSECLEYALTVKLPIENGGGWVTGVWGATTEAGRQQLRAKRVRNAELRHGTRVCYVKRRCRQPECVKANADAERVRWHRKKEAA